ncbi:MAG: hypothetical protein IKM46_05865 [Clostridia bacterium]|nr:hypothetical protein [Clostridia bacterium]
MRKNREFLNKSGDKISLKAFEKFFESYGKYGRYLADAIKKGDTLCEIYPCKIQRTYYLSYSTSEAVFDALQESGCVVQNDKTGWWEFHMEKDEAGALAEVILDVTPSDAEEIIVIDEIEDKYLIKDEFGTTKKPLLGAYTEENHDGYVKFPWSTDGEWYYIVEDTGEKITLATDPHYFDEIEVGDELSYVNHASLCEFDSEGRFRIPNNAKTMRSCDTVVWQGVFTEVELLTKKAHEKMLKNQLLMGF